MEFQSTPDTSDLAAAEPPPSGGSVRLRGPGLIAARVVSLGTVISVVALFVLAIPARRADLIETYRDLSPAQELILRELGVSGLEHAQTVLLVEILVPALFLAVALLILLRRSDDWVAMLVAIGLVTYISRISPPLDVLARTEPHWRLPVELVQLLGMTSALLFLYAFPDGRLVPRWTRFLLATWGAWALGWILRPGSVFDLSDPFRLSLLSFVALLFWLMSGMGAQLYRFLRVASPVQRQQTKAILFGTTTALVSYLVFGFDRFATPELAQPRFAGVVYDLVGVPIFLVTLLVIPVSFAVSILRYRLWEIDLVINRALVYGSLTAILAGLYTASILLFQRTFVALTGEKSDAAIVLTTLVVASAFTPVKGRLQTLVDRYVKPIPEPLKEVNALTERIGAFVEMIDPGELTRRALKEAVRAFGSTSGAVYLLTDGRFELTHVEGDWNQVEGMVAWLEAEGERLGWIALGRCERGMDYAPEDRLALENLANATARALRLVGRAVAAPSDRVATAGDARIVGRLS